MRFRRATRSKQITGAAVTICVASYNTRASTELCVRSIHEFAGYPFKLVVGDGGSTDGSVSMLEGFQARGWIELEYAPEGRLHAEWLDHWRDRADSELLAFVDSDVEFRRRNWLAEAVRRADRKGSAITFSEWLPEVPTRLGDRAVRLAGRPAPWLLLLAVLPLAPVKTSFSEIWTETEDVSEGFLVHDVGAAFYEAGMRLGVSSMGMPQTYRRKYHHYGGLSWLPSSGARGRKKQRDQRVVERRLRLLRIAQESNSPPKRLASRLLLWPPAEELSELGFRVSSRVGRILGRGRLVRA